VAMCKGDFGPTVQGSLIYKQVNVLDLSSIYALQACCQVLYSVGPVYQGLQITVGHRTVCLALFGCPKILLKHSL